MNREKKFKCLTECGDDKVKLGFPKQRWANYGLSGKNLFPEYKQITPDLQYTGLKDKSGTEIYEGDIVFTPGQNFCYRQVVEWYNDEGQYRLRNIGKYTSTGYPNIKLIERLECQHAGWFDCRALKTSIREGNIYQNPELLEQK